MFGKDKFREENEGLVFLEYTDVNVELVGEKYEIQMSLSREKDFEKVKKRLQDHGPRLPTMEFSKKEVQKENQPKPAFFCNVSIDETMDLRPWMIGIARVKNDKQTRRSGSTGTKRK